MFPRLFAESGLTLDRLRALLEVGAAGSIAKAVQGDPVRQSQYSRQIKELEDFFRTRLIERQGKGVKLTRNGRELARISRFFMLGLSNFQRGCLTEEQTFRIGASATFTRLYLLPALSGPASKKEVVSYVLEVLTDDEIESRLHDLTLDFGVVAGTELSRPLQMHKVSDWRLELWVPKTLRLTQARAAQAFAEENLPLALAGKELERLGVLPGPEYEARFVCDSFLDSRAAMDGGQVAALLPDFLAPDNVSKSFVRVPVESIDACAFHFHLAWNPRLLRLNPHAARRRDWLVEVLSQPKRPLSQ